MEGLRTLVFGQRLLSKQEYDFFDASYNKARASLIDREHLVQKAIESIEFDLEYLGVTGVEDKL
jgi:magnesium-transporting ATPase (P-type)